MYVSLSVCVCMYVSLSVCVCIAHKDKLVACPLCCLCVLSLYAYHCPYIVVASARFECIPYIVACDSLCHSAVFVFYDKCEHCVYLFLSLSYCIYYNTRGCFCQGVCGNFFYYFFTLPL